jgi:hypothetical protein
MPIEDALTHFPALTPVPAEMPKERALSFEAPIPGYADAWYRITLHEGTRRVRVIDIRTIASPHDALVARWGPPTVNFDRDFWRGPNGEHVVLVRGFVASRDPVASWFVRFARFEPISARVAALEAMVGMTREEIASRGRFGLELQLRTTDHGTLSLIWVDLLPTEWSWTGDERVFVTLGPAGRVVSASTSLPLGTDPAGPSSRADVEAILLRRFGPPHDVQILERAKRQYRRAGKTVISSVPGETSFDIDLEISSP